MRMCIIPVTLIGTLIGLSLFLGGCHAKKPSEHTDQMRLDDVPPVVQKALRREANGRPIDTITRHELNGTVDYTIHVNEGRTTWEVKVDPEGRLLSRRSEKGNSD
jgi:hypothetical protein